MDKTRRIEELPLFKGLPEEQLTEIAGIVQELKLERSSSIFSEGDEASGFYVVITGLVKIFKLSADGKEQILHILGPGEIFGEVPMFSGGNFPANSEAIEKSLIYFFPRKEFIRLISNEPSVAMGVIASLSKRLRQFTHLVESLSLKEVPGRLAAYLLYLSEEKGGGQEVDLRISKGQLSSLLGTIPETLSRILGKMSGKGIIEVKGRSISLLDMDALEDLAAGEKNL